MSSVLFVLVTFSCQKTEVIQEPHWYYTSNYLINSYLEADNISIIKCTSYKWNKKVYVIFFDGKKTIDKHKNLAEFESLSLKHGETGEKEIRCWGPPALFSKIPLNISKIKVSDKISGADISDKVLVMMEDIKDVILSDYDDKKVAYPDTIKKLVRDLDNDNLSYIPNPLILKTDDNQFQKDIDVEVTLSSGKVLKAEYKEK